MTITPLETTNYEAIPAESSRPLFWLFTWAYGFVFLFYLANFYSYGISFSYPSILLAITLLGPIFGFAFIFLDALLLKMTGRLVRGNANIASLRFALAYSKAPSMILIVIWMIVLAADPTTVFIQDASNGAAVTMIFSFFGIAIWSFCLLTKHLKRLQGISSSRALWNSFATYVLSFFIYATTLFIARYIYISWF
ncbi:MAG TPA: YIP1 family protein [Chlamydiales bacterium]|jgi:hypothetical protein|nr:YIP1 family protein [Chlamydiales bacterium]